MAGVKGLSGRKPNTLTVKESRARLQRMSKKALDNIEASVTGGDLDDSKWVMAQLLPKPMQSIDLNDHGLANSLVQLARQASRPA